MLLWFLDCLKILRRTNNSLKTDIWFSQVLQTTTVDEDEDASTEMFYNTLLDLLGKFDQSHIVALVIKVELSTIS